MEPSSGSPHAPAGIPIGDIHASQTFDLKTIRKSNQLPTGLTFRGTPARQAGRQTSMSSPELNRASPFIQEEAIVIASAPGPARIDA